VKFLIINTDYPHFLRWLYNVSHPNLASKPYREQLKARYESMFGLADSYSHALNELGHEAYDIFQNNETMQRQWYLEHTSQDAGTSISLPSSVRGILQNARSFAAKTPLRRFRRLFQPLLNNFDPHRWVCQILQEQLSFYRPDVVISVAIAQILPQFFKENRNLFRILIGQSAGPSPLPDWDYSCYDLLISSSEERVEYFRKRNLRSEFLPLAFDPRAIQNVRDGSNKHDVTFVGSVSSDHSSRVDWLTAVAEELPELKIWAFDAGSVLKDSILRERFQGEAWGVEMFQIFHDSKITLNHHGNVGPYANNMRLYEGTGMGTLLITDYKPNLGEILQVGREVLCYKTPKECVDLVRTYLKDDAARSSIAAAGQKRTLTEHLYKNRMQCLLDMIG